MREDDRPDALLRRYNAVGGVLGDLYQNRTITENELTELRLTGFILAIQGAAAIYLLVTGSPHWGWMGMVSTFGVGLWVGGGGLDRSKERLQSLIALLEKQRSELAASYRKAGGTQNLLD